MNVVILRIPQNLSVVWPNSHCPLCQHSIAWYDNVPIFSFFILKGRCRHCQGKIAYPYWIVELTLAVFSAWLFYSYIAWLPWLKWLTFFALLIAIAFIDARHYFIPLSLLLMLYLIGFISAYFSLSFKPYLWGGLTGYLFLAAIQIGFTLIFRKTGRITPDQWAMGHGDPLLLGAIGLWMGWQQLPILLFLACLQGLLAGLFFLWKQKPTESPDPDIPHGAIPFGPFLALAALEIRLLYPGI